MKTLNVVKTCGIVGTILTLLFVYALTTSCSNPGPERTIPKAIEVTTSVSGLESDDVLVTIFVNDQNTGEENSNWKKRTGNSTYEIGIEEPEEGDIYTVTAEAEGYTIQPESYEVRIGANDTAVITNTETGEEVSQLDFRFIPPDKTTQGVVSTEDIGFQYPAGESFQPTSFVPQISRDSAIKTARDLLKTGHGVQNADEMAARATVALFRGTQAWIVVLDTPFETGGPPPPTDNPDLRPTPVPLQFNVVVDAETGNVIYSVISGQVE